MRKTSQHWLLSINIKVTKSKVVYNKLYCTRYFFKFQFKTFVTSLEWAAGQWNVSYTKLDTKVQATEACDYIIVANGEFLNPYIPKLPGIDLFKGKIIREHKVVLNK